MLSLDAASTGLIRGARKHWIPDGHRCSGIDVLCQFEETYFVNLKNGGMPTARVITAPWALTGALLF